MSSGRDEVEKSVNTVVPEAGVTLNARLLREDVVVLALEVANNLLESGAYVQVGATRSDV